MSQEIESLLNAIVMGKKRFVYAYFKKNPETKLNDSDQLGFKLLKEAIISQDIEMARFLCSLGIDLHNDLGPSLLKIAVKKNNKPMVALLLEQGVNINAEINYGETAPFLCVETGNIEMLDFLMQKGADMHHKSNFKETVLQKAINLNQLEVVRFLLEKGFDKELQEEPDKPYLHMPAQQGYIEMIKLLLPYKINVNAKRDWGRTALFDTLYNINNPIAVATLLLDNGADTEITDELGNTVLCESVSRKNPELMKFFLKRGASIKGVAGQNSPLHCAVAYRDLETAEFLIKGGADIEILDKDGCTPLHNVIYFEKGPYPGDAEMANFLLDNGANIHAKDTKYGLTLLHKAARRGSHELLNTLLNRGANIEEKTFGGATPLHYTIAFDRVETAELLLNRGADITAVDNYGDTVLHYACYSEAPNILQLFLNRGAKAFCDVKNNNGLTPLHVAVQKGYANLAVVLLQNGADPMIKDNQGEDAFSLLEKWYDNEKTQSGAYSDCHQKYKEMKEALLQAVSDKKAKETTMQELAVVGGLFESSKKETKASVKKVKSATNKKTPQRRNNTGREI